MRSFDFTPLYRSAVGFDRVMDLLEHNLQGDQSSEYPPYNIEKTGENTYSITLAVAGFEPEELTITAQQNSLLVSGKKAGEEQGEYLFKGIASRTFERRFNLADYIVVTGADLQNGLLSIQLVREVPEAKKPRQIPIGKGAAGPKVIEHGAAA